MTIEEYTVKSGDTLSRIARQHNIRHWQNVYLATANIGFMEKRTNPDLIYPGDVVRIPPTAAIAPMEANPIKSYRDFPILWPQSTASTCWRAVGFMLYARKHNLTDAATAQADFERRLGPELNALSGGLPWNRSNDVYVTKLGLRAHNIASINEVNKAIAVNGPAIVSFHDGVTGHAMIITGYNILPGNWTLLDPLGGSVTSYDFDTDGSVTTGYTPGDGNWDSMTLTRGFFEGASIDPRIFTA